MRHSARTILSTLLVCTVLVAGAVQGQQPTSQRGGSTGIGGTVVNAASGRPEAGVWVIA